MSSANLTLGFDSSGGWCGAALMSGTECLAALYEDMDKGQAERLFPMLESVLSEAGAGWQDLDRIGVGIGPGNFTGIRISVAAARGLALSLDVPAIGISLLDALAHGSAGPTLACVDARRGQGYFKRHGFGDARPFMAPVDAVPDVNVPGLNCIGTCAVAAAKALGAFNAPAAYAPASAIARLAASTDPHKAGRPAPMYLRAADAAPPRDPAPTILP